jgi:HSP20 family protein
MERRWLAMPIADLIHWKRKEPVSLEKEPELQIEEHPLTTLREAVDDLFDDFFGESGLGSLGRPRGGWEAFDPQIDAVESDEDIRVSVELPGMDEKDIDVTVSRDTLTIGGNKRQEEREEGHNYYHAERSYGSFRRSVPLPCEVDASRADAVFRKGLLTITLPKVARSSTSKHIDIRTR